MVESIKNQIKDWKDIKSIYTLNLIFSFLEENHKLNMVIYNKHLQQKFGLDIQYYKNKSGKYKIGKKNWIGKEYELDSNELIFEGEYLNGKKNGKGKEYDYDGKLIFEGKYLNGVKNGKGKEYYYEGEFKDGEKWDGNGYDKNHSVIYRLINGKGNIKEYNDWGGLEFEGEYLNGKRNGKGK